MANWYAEAARYLGGFPDNYLVFDAETQGLQPESPSTLPTELGFAVYRGGKLVESGDYYMNWTVGPAAVDGEWFRRSLRDTAEAMASKGKVYHGSWQLIEKLGTDPLEGLQKFRDLFVDCKANGFSLVGHNAWAYDRRLLEHCWRRHNMPFEIDVEHMVDTGLLVKCSQLNWTPPLPGSCARHQWYQQISNTRSRVRWALDGYCAEHFGLAARHGLNTEAAHTAGFDCVVCASLLDALRELADRGD